MFEKKAEKKAGKAENFAQVLYHHSIEEDCKWDKGKTKINFSKL